MLWLRVSICGRRLDAKSFWYYELIDSLRAENDKLRLFCRSEAGESELLVNEILRLIHGASSNAVKMYINSIYALCEGKPINRVRLCLAVMASTREGDTIFNNCCQKAAGRVLVGEMGMMALGKIMWEVAIDCDKRRERSQQY